MDNHSRKSIRSHERSSRDIGKADKGDAEMPSRDRDRVKRSRSGEPLDSCSHDYRSHSKPDKFYDSGAGERSRDASTDRVRRSREGQDSRDKNIDDRYVPVESYGSSEKYHRHSSKEDKSKEKRARDDKYSSREDRLREGSGDDKYSSKEDKSKEKRPRDDKYSSKEDRLREGSRDDKYSSKQDKLREGSRDDKYPSKEDRLKEGRKDDKYQSKEGRLREGSRDDKYPSKEDKLREGNRDDKYPSKEDRLKEGSRDDKYQSKEGRLKEDGSDDRYPSKEDRLKEGRRDKDGRKIKEEKVLDVDADGYNDLHRSREINDPSRKMERNYESGADRVKRSGDAKDSRSHTHSHGGERDGRGDGRSHKRRERESEERKDKTEKRRRVEEEDTGGVEKTKFDVKVEEEIGKEEADHGFDAPTKREPGEGISQGSFEAKNDGNGSLATSNKGRASDNGVQEGIPIVASSDLPNSLAALEIPSETKVSTVLPTNTAENKGVNNVRSHEISAKTSTDASSSAAGKGGSLSLDALAKAKKALQIQKELSEKLKKLPQLSKSAGPSSGATSSAVVSAEKPGGASSTVTAAIAGSFPSTVPMATTIQSSVAPSTSLPAPMTVGNVKLVPGMPGVVPAVPGHANIPNYEAVKRAQELAAKLGFHQDPELMPFLNMFPGQVSDEFGTAGQQKPAKAPVLRLDAHGREIDEHGNVIEKPKITNLSTLKVNINKQKKEAFQILRPELDEDPNSNPHFDPRMGVNKTKLLRPKRMTFQFVEEGRWSKQAELFKFKSQFGEAQAKELKIKQAQLAKAKAEADINPNLIEVSERVSTKEEKPKDPIPDVEWWDAVLLPSGNYDDCPEGNLRLKMEKLTIYVEHPLPIEPPAEPFPPPPQPLKLTKKEQKKLRTQRRLAKEKDRQEMIRQGLIEPPKPKVKMSNLMKVLGSEATQDPTRLEMEIRTAAAEREQAHVDRNIARKLTPAERREKKEKKLFEDPNTLETIVSVYKINDLSHPQTRFKVDINAQENRLSGCAVISDGMSVVVVEGGSKSIKRYGKLMLRRINWAAAVVNEEDEEQDEDRTVNKCMLVWQGSVAKPSFKKFVVQQCRTEAAARKFFADAGVAHYWDLAVNFSDDQPS